MIYIIYDDDGKILQASSEQPKERIMQRMGWSNLIEVDRPLFDNVDAIQDYYIQNGELKKEVNNRVEQEAARISLMDTDWKVARHLEQKAQDIETSLTDAEYDALLIQRQEWRDLID